MVFVKVHTYRKSCLWLVLWVKFSGEEFSSERFSLWDIKVKIFHWAVLKLRSLVVFASRIVNPSHYTRFCICKEIKLYKQLYCPLFPLCLSQFLQKCALLQTLLLIICYLQIYQLVDLTTILDKQCYFQI